MLHSHKGRALKDSRHGIGQRTQAGSCSSPVISSCDTAYHFHSATTNFRQPRGKDAAAWNCHSAAWRLEPDKNRAPRSKPLGAARKGGRGGGRIGVGGALCASPTRVNLFPLLCSRKKNKTLCLATSCMVRSRIGALRLEVKSISSFSADVVLSVVGRRGFRATARWVISGGKSSGLVLPPSSRWPVRAGRFTGQRGRDVQALPPHGCAPAAPCAFNHRQTVISVLSATLRG